MVREVAQVSNRAVLTSVILSVNNIGPQTSFPVPQGILNYNGINTLAVSLWAAGSGGARLDSLSLKLTAQVESSMQAVVNQPFTPWAQRPGAF